MNGILKGKKTYVTAALTVLGSIAAYLMGEAALADTIQLVVMAVLGATVRNAIPDAKKK